ncbi:hypothetical protein BS47DRAFT_689195 [Hydnum rufescens UP504]|uniref:Uncharacterized protein n=1 Tax=Hydnum rufescens UP504 TaxID=1448309 RepID=A0A9P6B256_9AGAM|nr:hypothetical protein BS47DRAFT_689195 [Hydnum rufescens UP504]
MGRGPFVLFDPENNKHWAMRLRVAHELQASYTRAHAFFKKRCEELITNYAWRSIDWGRKHHIFRIATKTPPSPRYPSHTASSPDLTLQLPKTLAQFLKLSHREKWRRMFEDRRIFQTKRLNQWSHDLFIDSCPPLADIMYMLQVLVPGMLLLVRVDHIPTVGDQKITRALPPEEWTLEHAEELEYILGSRPQFEHVLRQAGRTMAIEITWDRSEYCEDAPFG